MPLDALALALGAAGLHALWNLLLARERDTEAATAVALLALVVVLALPAALTWRVESAAVPFIVGSAALELAYVALLAAAYRRYELSLVYPVARGLAPVLALADRGRGGRREALGARRRRGAGRGGRRAARARRAEATSAGSSSGSSIAAAIAGYTVRRPLRDPARGRGAVPVARDARAGARLPAAVGRRRVRAAVVAGDGRDRRRVGGARTCSCCSPSGWRARRPSPPCGRRAS